MTDRLEKAIRALSPDEVEQLTKLAEAMAMEPRARGRKLRVDWADCIDSEHVTGLDAQRDAMNEWTRAIERSLEA